VFGWRETGENVLRLANYTNVAYICNKFFEKIKTFKSILLWVFPFYMPDFFDSFRNILREFHCIFLIKKLSIWTSILLFMHYFAFSFFFQDSPNLAFV
jgi:hypothetical protein